MTVCLCINSFTFNSSARFLCVMIHPLCFSYVLALFLYIMFHLLYWSKRYEKPCICDSYMGFMAYVVFLDKKDSGWYHCQELEEMELDKRKTN